MDPLSALVFAIIVATAVVAAMEGDVAAAAARGAWRHGRAQAAAEARRARQAILDGAKDRLRSRLEQGSRSSPASGWWWAWAAVRSAKALRSAMRGARKGATALPSAATPLRRVWHAVRAGARKGAQAAKARRPAGDRWWRRAARNAASAFSRKRRHARRGQQPPRMGTCDRCGAIAAETALAQEERDGERLLLCAGCRLGPQPQAQPTATQEPSQQPRSGAEPEGEKQNMPRELAPAGAGALAGPSQRVTGEVHTHGDFMRQVAALREAVGRLPVFIEGIKGNLTAADAGREQVADVLRHIAAVQQLAVQLGEMASKVDSRQRPVVQAVTDAGGPCEVASPRYMAEV